MAESEPRWRGTDGTPIACREKLKVLEENWAEVTQVVRDAFEDAVLMGVDPELMRRELAALVAGLRPPGGGR
ncbi:hypothetical protein [Elioraea thermophila]|uniref:hypothetical protein n=1 Tax=Elioraea thermophila TaxID=2185104 RepID=UPI000DF31172|nr:hypothetical protein [Elioraea thermophila]